MSKPRECACCKRFINTENKSGLCRECHNMARKVETRERERAILASLEAGMSCCAVAAEHGVSTYRVRRVSDDYLPPKMPEVRLADIVAAALHQFGISRESLTGEDRQHKFTMARQAICRAAMAMGHSSTAIGKAIGRDHSTVLHGRNAAGERARRDPDFAARIDAIKTGIAPKAPAKPLPITAPRIQAYKPAPPIVVKTDCKPKNDFTAGTAAADTSHIFHRNIALANNEFVAALLRERKAMAA